MIWLNCEVNEIPDFYEEKILPIALADWKQVIFMVTLVFQPYWLNRCQAIARNLESSPEIFLGSQEKKY